MKEILEPIKEYENYKKQYLNLVQDAIERIKEKSNIDIASNHETIKNYNNACNKTKLYLDKWYFFDNLFIALNIIAIVFGVLTLVGGVFLALHYTKNIPLLYGIIFFFFFPVLAIATLLLNFFEIKKIVKTHNDKKYEWEKVSQEYLKQAWLQMSDFNKLLEDTIPNKLFNQLGTVISLSNIYSGASEEYLLKNCKLPKSLDDRTTIDIVAGSIAENPFVTYRERTVKWENYRYTASIVVNWVVPMRDAQGRIVPCERSQVLTGYIDAPIPVYSDSEQLVYANNAAPDLNFSGYNSYPPKGALRYKIYINHNSKRIKTEYQNSIVLMSDMEFETLFSAVNRDNEDQFRILFTPLAQKNVIKYVKNRKDYFACSLIKRGKLNYLSSYSFKWYKMYGDRCFKSYSYDETVQNFKQYCNDFFYYTYFSLVPLLNIPIYQQLKPNKEDINVDEKFNFSERQVEMLANLLDYKFLANNDCATKIISKIEFSQKCGAVDVVNIKGNGYRKSPRVTNVLVGCDDGNCYNVAVPWYEYEEVCKTNLAFAFDANSLKEADKEKLLDLLKENAKKLNDDSTACAYASCCGAYLVIPKSDKKDFLLEKIKEMLV